MRRDDKVVLGVIVAAVAVIALVATAVGFIPQPVRYVADSSLYIEWGRNNGRTGYEVMPDGREWVFVHGYLPWMGTKFYEFHRGLVTEVVGENVREGISVETEEHVRELRHTARLKLFMIAPNALEAFRMMNLAPQGR